MGQAIKFWGKELLPEVVNGKTMSYTVFLPTNNALRQKYHGKANLRDVLQRHTVPMKVDFSSTATYTTLAGNEVHVSPVAVNGIPINKSWQKPGTVEGNVVFALPFVL